MVGLKTGLKLGKSISILSFVQYLSDSRKVTMYKITQPFSMFSLVAGQQQGVALFWLWSGLWCNLTLRVS